MKCGQDWPFAGVLPNGKVVLNRGIRNSSEAGPVGSGPIMGSNLFLQVINTSL